MPYALSLEDRTTLERHLRSVPNTDDAIVKLLVQQSAMPTLDASWTPATARAASWYLIAVFEWDAWYPHLVRELSPALIRWVLVTQFRLVCLLDSEDSANVLSNLILLSVVASQHPQLAAEVCGPVRSRLQGSSSAVPSHLVDRYIGLVQYSSLHWSQREDSHSFAAMVFDYACLLANHMVGYMSLDEGSGFRVVAMHAALGDHPLGNPPH